jgi:hypothetical protein
LANEDAQRLELGNGACFSAVVMPVGHCNAWSATMA